VPTHADWPGIYQDEVVDSVTKTSVPLWWSDDLP